jgi:hypothetical protein
MSSLLDEKVREVIRTKRDEPGFREASGQPRSNPPFRTNFRFSQLRQKSMAWG